MKKKAGILLVILVPIMLNSYTTGCLDNQSDELEPADGYHTESDDITYEDRDMKTQVIPSAGFDIDDDGMYHPPDYSHLCSIEHFGEAYSLARNASDLEMVFWGIQYLSSNLTTDFYAIIYNFYYYDYDTEHDRYYSDFSSRVIYRDDQSPVLEMKEKNRRVVSKREFRWRGHPTLENPVSCEEVIGIALDNETVQRDIGNMSEYGFDHRVSARVGPQYYSWCVQFTYTKRTSSIIRCLLVHISGMGIITLVRETGPYS